LKYILRLVLFILLLTNYSVFSAELDARFLKTLAFVESNNNPRAYNPRNKEMGIFQVTPICYKDVQKINPKFNSFPRNYCYDSNFCYVVLITYLNFYEPTAVKNKDCDSLLRLWNSGPNWRNKKNKTNNYVRRFFKEYGLTK